MLVKPKPISEYPWYIRLFFWKQRRTYGKVLDPGLLWGRSPRVFAPMALLYGALNRRSSPLDPALRSLVTVRVSQINHCAFCVDINSATLEQRGVSEAKILALHDWHESDLFTPVERVALGYAEAITLTGGEITDGVRAGLNEHFDQDSIAELTGLIAFQNMSSKFNAALDVPPQGFCQVPDLQSGRTVQSDRNSA